MSNLFGIGLSGLGAAQAGLNTTSNNIANVNTPGYTRRAAVLGQAPVSRGQGSGVLVSGIQRQYQRFLSEQLNNAESRASALDAHLTQMSRVNNLLGDSDAGLAPLIQEFFASVQTVAGDPADPAARESLLGDAHNMASQFRTFSAYLADMHDSVEMQLQGAVEQINNYGRQVAELNEQISLTRARTGQPPNKLLDQRNQLVSELGKLVDVTVTIQDGEQYMLMVAGRSLVDATGAHSFEMTVSSRDPSRRVIAYRTPTGGLRELDPNSIAGGTVGGLIEFRHASLQPAELRVNQLAHALAMSVNNVHQAGYDLAGTPGQAFFTVSTPLSHANADNTGSATLAVSFTPGGLSDVAASNYRIEYLGASQYQITRLADGVQLPPAAGPSFSVAGFSVSVIGSANVGDSFVVKPLAGAAADLTVAITDPAAIAADGVDTNADGVIDSSGGPGSNGGALALADLQNQLLVGGGASFNSAYAQLVTDVGNTTRSLQVNSAAQTSLTTELQKAEQSVSGVNLAEERVNLLYYSKLYQANAKIIQTATNLFDTILRIA